jgi:hypothetical protein
MPSRWTVYRNRHRVTTANAILPIIRRVGRAALLGALLLIGSAVSFLRSHIYFPIGVLTMLVMAIGFAWLQRARLGGVAAIARVSDNA